MDSKEIRINFKAQENISEVTKKIRDALDRVQRRFSQFSEATKLALGFLGLKGGEGFMEMANGIQEIDNRMHLLVQTTKLAGLSFQGLAKDALASRTSLEDYSEMFMRIGMTAGHSYMGKENQLREIIMTLNKQFQSMHLTPSQLMSVNTAILDAVELGYFDWRHMKALMMHDNPLAKGFIQYMGLSGEQITEASKNHLLTSDKFFDYVLKSSKQINDNFDRLPYTLNQMGTILKTQIEMSLVDIVQFITMISNKIFKIFNLIGERFPIIATFLRNFLGIFIAISVVMGMIMTMAIILKSLFGGIGKTIASVAAASAISALALTAMGMGKEKIIPSEQTNILGEIGVNIAAIKDETEGINDKMSFNKSTLSDLITKTENFIISNNFNNSINLGGNRNNQSLADELIRQLQHEMSLTGARH